MRIRYPSRRTRVGVLLAVLAAAVLKMYPEYVYPFVLPRTYTESWFPTRRVHDEAHFLTKFAAWKYEEELGQVLDESGADVQFAFVRDVPGGNLESYALQRMRTMGVGKTVDRRGLLFVYDVGTRRLRIEVGPNMEGIFPDGFIGYLMREHTASFFASESPELGFRTTLTMIRWRIRSATLGLDYDPTAISLITDSVRLAAGGGATTARGAGAAGFAGRHSTPEERVHYSAQPTPELAHLRFMEWLRDGQKLLDVDLFTPDSRTYLRTLPMTRGYMDFMLLNEYHQNYRIEERASRAMLYFTSTPFVSPHYFRKTPSGWQVDAVAEAMNAVEYGGGQWTYGVIKSDDDFTYAFADMMDDYGYGMFRVRDADNRPLPIHSVP